MRINDVLRVKGGQVVTVTPETRVDALLTVLAEHRIGAIVVSSDGFDRSRKARSTLRSGRIARTAPTSAVMEAAERGSRLP